MARFGEEFVRQASNPSFLGGLFTAGQAAGSYGRRKEKEAKKKALAKGLLGLEAMNQSGELTSDMYQDAVKSYAELGVDAESRAMIQDTMRRVGQNFTPEAQMQRELAEIRLGQARTEQRNANLLLVAGNMTKEQRERYLADERVPEADKNVFRNFEDTLRKHEMNTAEYEGWKESMDTPIPTQGTQDLIEMIQDEKKREAVQQQFDNLKESTPKKFSNTAQRTRALDAFKRLDGVITNLIGNEQNRIQTEDLTYTRFKTTQSNSARNRAITEATLDAEVERLRDLSDENLLIELKTYLPKEQKQKAGWWGGDDEDQLKRLATQIIIETRVAAAEAQVDKMFGRTGSEETETEPEIFDFSQDDSIDLSKFEVGKQYESEGVTLTYIGNGKFEGS